MLDFSYNPHVSNEGHKNLNFAGGEIQSPPMSAAARREVGFYLRQVQGGRLLGMPVSRPMPSIGPAVHELRIIDRDTTWRVVYRVGDQTIDVLDAFAKKTRATPKEVIDRCRKRLKKLEG